MKIVNVINEDENVITICWDVIPNCNKYYLEGKNGLFNYEMLLETNKNEIIINKNDYKDYLSFRIVYISELNQKEIIVDKTEDFEINNLIIESNLSISAIKSYKGISISFATKVLYDKYYLYEKVKNIYKLLIVSEDFQFTSNLIKKNHTYMVEAYKIENKKEILRAKSKDFVCVFKEFNLKKKDLSVVIPSYNEESFLPRTIDSVLLSTFENIEIIIVNDGSTDSTEDVLEWYKKNYKCIKVVNLEHKGASYARNFGRDMATAPYLAFLDGDDLVHPFMYDLLYRSITQEDADVAIAKVYVRNDYFKGNYVLNVDTHGNDYLIYDYYNMFNEYKLNTFNNIFFVSVCNKIVKREILNKVDSPVGYHYEDSAITPAVYSYADKFVFVGNALYIWEQRKRLTVGTFSTEYKKIGHSDLIKKYFEALVYPLKVSNKEKYDYVLYYSLKSLLSYFDKVKQSENKDEVIKEYARNISKLIKDSKALDSIVLKEDRNFYYRLLDFDRHHKEK